MPESTSFLAVEELDAAGTLAAAEAAVRDRRAGGGGGLGGALHWAHLHGHDPGDGAHDEPRLAARGGTRLVQVGGASTPAMQDLALCELAIARGQHTLATRALIADGLDLRHRLPELFTALREGRCDL